MSLFGTRAMGKVRSAHIPTKPHSPAPASSLLTLLAPSLSIRAFNGPVSNWGASMGNHNGKPNSKPASHNGPGVPRDLDAERAVLGSLLLDPGCFITIEPIVREADFYREHYAWIFGAIRDLINRREPVDFVTLTSELEAKGKFAEIGGPATLTDLVSNTITSLHAEYYARLVANMAIRRRMISAAQRIVEKAYDLNTDINAALDASEQEILRVASSRQDRNVRHIKDILAETLKQMEAAANGERVGIPTGFGMLDRVLGGLQRSDLIVMAGRPGMGKSSLGLSIVKNAINLGARALLFSVEMSDTQVANRLLSMETGIDSARLRTGNGLDDTSILQIMTVCNDLSNTQLFIDDTPALGIGELRRKARQVYAEHGLDLIVVDYVQIMTLGEDGNAHNREQEVSQITRKLKALARELDVPIIALAQLSRSVDSRNDKRPMLSDLRESGAIEQDADVVMFIYREDYYIEDTDRQNIADVIVAKHRHGPTGTASLYFRKELTEFRDLEIKRTEPFDDIDENEVLVY